MSDPVKHPSHYADGPYRTKSGEQIECIDVTKHMNFCRGNAVKYLWRAGVKDPAKEIEDVEKAREYLDFEIERLRAKMRRTEAEDALAELKSRAQS